MYAPYFGLRQAPFSIAPDPRYLFMSERHREALAHLLYGVSCGGGFVLLTGEIGTGKTTVCRSFLEQVPPDCDLAYIFNPKLTALELLQSICEEFHVPLPPREGVARTVKDYIDPLNAFLLQAHARGRNNVLIIDEAQNLAPEVLEQLRLLTNLETNERKLLQIILIGQPELRDMLARPELEQLAQRVIARYHLLPLNERETAQYVRHRLEIAGLSRVGPFERRAIRRIHRLARGNPRRINLLCDRALLGAFSRSRGNVNVDTVNEAAREVFGERPARSRTRLAAIGGAAVIGVGAVMLALYAVSGTRWGGGPTALALMPLSSLGVAPPPDASASDIARGTVRPAGVTLAVPVTAGPARLLSELDLAWRELSGLWQVELPERGAACSLLADHDLQCFNRSLGLPLIRALNRPGIVTLDAPGAAPSYALLVRLTDDSATLRAAGTEQTVTLRALAARWKGDFATIWRVPPGYTGSPEDGWRGPVLSWAATQLADGNAKARADMVRSGKEMRERLRTFQVAQGLPATGTLTPLTYMQLNRAADVDEPRLITQP
jgi:general secretion pathway protein A